MTGEEMREMREARGFNQEAFANASGWSRRQVIRWEQSEEVPRYVEIVVTALQMRVTVQTVMLA